MNNIFPAFLAASLLAASIQAAEITLDQIEVWGVQDRVDYGRLDRQLAIDGDDSTWSYVTRSGTQVPVMVGLNFAGGYQSVNRIRVGKRADVDGIGTAVDTLNLRFFVTWDFGPLKDRTWHQVSWIEGGFRGTEIPNSGEVVFHWMHDDRHDYATDGAYSVNFQGIGATGVAIEVTRDPGDDLHYTHYPAYFIEAHYDQELDLKWGRIAFSEVQVWHSVTGRSSNRGDQALAIDGRYDRLTYLTPSTANAGPYEAGFSFDGVRRVNRLRVAKHTNVDATGDLEDFVDLEWFYTIGSGALSQRRWLPLTNLKSGFDGAEEIVADSVSGNRVDRDYHHFATDGFYSLTFDAVQATGFMLRFKRDPADDRDHGHYAVYEVEAYYQGTLDHSANALPLDDIDVWWPSDGSNQNRGDEDLAIDNDTSTSSYLTPSAGQGPYQFGVNLADGLQMINQVRIAKDVDADGTQTPVDHMDLAIYYTTGTGPLALRQWLPVTTLESGMLGKEHVVANWVSGNQVDNEATDFSQHGFFSLTFDAVEATGLSIWINRDAADTEPYTHYPVHDIEVLYQPARLVSNAVAPIDDFLVWGPVGKIYAGRGDEGYATDNRLDTWSYLTPSSYMGVVRFAGNLQGGAQRINRLRVAKQADLDGVENPVDSANLTVLYTTGSGPLSERTWYPVPNLDNGFNGSERIVADAVNSDGTVEGDRHDFYYNGFYSLTFDAVNATGIGLEVARPAGDRQFTHYPTYSFEAHYEASIDPSVNRLPLSGIDVWYSGSGASGNRGDGHLAIDGRTDTFSYLTEPSGTGPYRIGLELDGGPTRVNRLRVAKEEDADGTGYPVDNMDLEIYYTTDTGPMANRSWHRVSGLQSGFRGIEKITADSVDPDGFVDNDHHDFETSGYYSLTFEAVNATAIAINVSRDAVDPQNYVHYPSFEIELHYEPGIDISAARLPFDDIQVWYPSDLSNQNRGDQQLAIDGTVGTFSYLTPGAGAGPYQVGVNLRDGRQRVNRLRVAKRADVDGVGAAIDRMDIDVYYTTDIGQMSLRTWRPVSTLRSGFQGKESLSARKVDSNGHIFEETHDYLTEGYYTLMFDAVDATGFSFVLNRSVNDSRNYTHYPIYEIEAHYEESADLSVQSIPISQILTWNPNDGSNQDRGDGELSIDGDLSTFSYLTPGAGAGPYQIGLNFADGATRVNRFRVAKRADADGAGGPVDRMDLVLYYTTDSGPMEDRTWHRVSGMTSGFNGREFVRAESVSADGSISGETTEFSETNFYSLIFDGVEATGLSLWANRSPNEDRNYTHYPVYEFQAIYEPSLDNPEEIPIDSAPVVSSLLQTEDFGTDGIVVSVEGINDMDLLLFDVKGSPGKSSAGLMRWNALTLPVVAATIDSQKQQIELTVGFKLPEAYFTDSFNQPIQETIQLLVDSGGNVSIVGGHIYIPELKFGKSVVLKNLNLAYDSLSRTFQGGVEVEVGKGIPDPCNPFEFVRRTVGGAITIQDGEVTALTVSGNDLRISMGAAKLNLLQGTVVDIPDIIRGTKPFNIAARAVINGGCVLQVAAQDVYPFTADVTGTFSASGYLDMVGAAKIYNVQAAEAKLRTDSNGIQLSGKISFFDVYEPSFSLTAGKSGFWGSGRGVLKVPNSVPVVGGYTFSDTSVNFGTDGFSGQIKVPLTDAVSGTCVGGYNTRVGYTGRIFGYPVNLCCIDVWVPRVCTPSIPATSLDLSFSYRADSGFSFDTRSSRPGSEGQRNFERRSSVQNPENGATLSFFDNWNYRTPLVQQRSTTPGDDSTSAMFVVDEGTPGIIFRATSADIMDVAASIKLRLPSGDELYLEDGPLPEGFDYAPGYARLNPEAEELIFFLYEPVPGSYELILEENPNEVEVEFHSLVQQSAPDLYVYYIEGYEDDDGLYLSGVWYLDGISDVAEAEYYLVADNESEQGYFIGSEFYGPDEIEDGLYVSFLPEDLIDIPPGEYYFMVRVDDGVSEPQYRYSDITIEIPDPLAPEPVAALRSGGDNGRINLEWDPSPSDDVAFYKVMYTEDIEGDTLISDILLPPSTLEHSITGLDNGRPYLATVLAVGSDDRESSILEIHRVVPTKGVGFTPPFITSEPDSDATAGYLWVYYPFAYDADRELIPSPEDIDPEELEDGGGIEGFGQLRWSLDVAPTGMTVDPSGLLQWTPTASQVGTHEVVLRVTKDLMVGLPERELRPTVSGVQRFEISVLAPENLNGLEDVPYQFISQPVLQANFEELYTYEPMVLMPDDADFFLDMGFGPDWLWIDEDNVLYGYPDQEEETGDFVWLRGFVCPAEEDGCWVIDQVFYLHLARDELQISQEPAVSGFEVSPGKAMISWVGDTENLVIQRSETLLGDWETVFGPAESEVINRFIDGNVPSESAFYRVVPLSDMEGTD